MRTSKGIDISMYIREAAFSLFLEKGYDGTNIREIADEAGYKAPSLYFYYKSKSELFLQVLEDVWQNYINTLERLIVRDKKMSIEDGKECFCRRIESIYNDFAAYRFLLRYRVFPAHEISNEIREIYQKWEQTEKEMQMPLIQKFLLNFNVNNTVTCEMAYAHMQKILNRIINDIVISGQYVEDEDIEMYWNRLISIFYKQ